MDQPPDQDIDTFHAAGGKGINVLLGDDDHHDWLTPLGHGGVRAFIARTMTWPSLLRLAIPSEFH